MNDEKKKAWDEQLSHFVRPQKDPLCLYALCLAADEELNRLRDAAEWILSGDCDLTDYRRFCDELSRRIQAPTP